ncbi:MAG: thrombospondin type 3 repeat-containing protein, partial [Verrucomicrobiales bacterium]|nr:thrombospondin type 3 repeat-containing protein [Verrucomicrobiales bacterium]
FQLLATGGGPPPTDLDGDGLSDAEEDIAGTDRFNPDTDSDGQSDGAEVKAAGTDPLNPSSVLRIVSINAPSSEVTLTWTSVPGKTYTIQVATALGGWNTLNTGPYTASAATTTATVDIIRAGQPEKQYRVLVSE